METPETWLNAKKMIYMYIIIYWIIFMIMKYDNEII